MSFANVNGLKLFYEIHGEGEPLILINGLGGNHLGWLTIFSQLTKKYQVIIFDNRGAGQSEVPKGPYKIADMAEDVVALLDHLNIKKANVMGNSMGGAIVQTLLLHHAGRFNKAVILGSFSQIPEAGKLAVTNSVDLMKAGTNISLIMDQFIPWVYGNDYLSIPGCPKEVKEMMLANPYPQTPEGYLGQYEATIDFDIRDELKSIEHDNVSILTGADDVLTPPHCSKIMHEGIPCSQLKIIEGAGHMIHVEKPDAVLKEWI